MAKNSAAVVTADGEIVPDHETRLRAWGSQSEEQLNALWDAATEVRELTGDLSDALLKEDLVSVPFAVAGWKWLESDEYTTPDGEAARFAVLHIIRMDAGHRGEEAVLTTGETGIVRALEVAEQRGISMIRCEHGLKRSPYKERGRPGEAGYRPAGVGYWFA